MLTAYQFWQRVDVLRGDKTLKEIAEDFHLNYATIKDMRTKDRYPKLEVCAGLARSLGTSLDYLITGDEARLSTPEARYVDTSPEAQALVRAIMRDPQLLQALGALALSAEKTLKPQQTS